METTLPPLPNQKAVFSWEGVDFRGQKYETSASANISIGFVYKGEYSDSARDRLRSFGQPGSSRITGDMARQEFVFWKHSQLFVNPPRVHDKHTGKAIAEGWSISAHHAFSPVNPTTILKGDGTIFKGTKDQNAFFAKVIAGSRDYYTIPYNGIDALSAQLVYLFTIDTDISGNPFFFDDANCLWMIDENGKLRNKAGRHRYENHLSCDNDGCPAIYANLVNFPENFVIDAENNYFIVDSYDNKIRKIDENGIISTIAGAGAAGYSGDNGLAINAKISVSRLAADNSGNLYFLSSAYNVIRKIDPDGIITTVAGNGLSGNGADNIKALDSPLNNAGDIAVDPAGNLYICENWHYKVRRVDNSGVITTVAGNGSASGSFIEGERATNVSIRPERIDVDKDGNLYIIPSNKQVVYKVNQAGTIMSLNLVFEGETYDEGAPYNFVDLRVHPSGIFIADVGASSMEGMIYNLTPISGLQRFINIDEGEIPVVDNNGLLYVMSSNGEHKSTIDMASGVSLYSFEYSNDRLSAITDQFGNQTRINRNADGTPCAIVSPDGLITLLAVDTNNYLSKITLADGEEYNFAYTLGGSLVSKTDPRGNSYQYWYDDSGRVTDAFDQEGGHLEYSSDVDGSSVTTAEGNTFVYHNQMSSSGEHVSQTIDPAGETRTIALSANKISLRETSSCGVNRKYVYDFDRIFKYRFVKEITETTPSGLTMLIEKDNNYQDTNYDKIPDQIIQTVIINGKTSIIENDILSSTITIGSPENRSVIATYDSDTLITTRTQIAGLNPTYYQYFADGKLSSVTTGSRQTAFSYDARGYLASVTDPRHMTTNFVNDAMGRVTRVDRPDGTSLGFSYDANGNMTMLTNPSEADHDFAYNKVDLASSYTTPLSGSYSYVYDKDRRLVEKNFPSGRSIFFDYENPSNPSDKSRLWRISTPERDINYTYLCGEKVGSVSSGSESITYAYDGKLVTSEALAGTLNKTLGYTWNADFALSSCTYAGATESYAYDKDGLLTRAGTFTISRYNDDGVNETGLPYNVSNGVLALNRTFNGYGETGGEDSRVNGRDVYAWGVADRYTDGRIKTKTETINGVTVTYDYSYDALGRLLTVVKDGTLAEEYAYDNVPYGTCTYQANTLRGITGRELSYDSEDRLLSSGGTEYSYDADGFLTSKSTATETTGYDYSSRGELLGVNLPDGKVITYVHDPLGRRIAKKVNGTITEKYLWSGLTTLLAVYDGSNNLLMRFKYADGRMPVAVEKAGATYYLAYDQVGTLRAVADSTGNVVKEISYDSFGFVLSDTNPAFDVPFGFAGGLYDRDTGLVRFGYRDYDPDTGRWTAKDPIGFAGGDSDLYGYCINDPINRIDTLGFVTAVITISDSGVGTHSAVYVDNNGDQAIYDPAGSYGDRESIGSGDLITGSAADLGTYSDYHLDQGSEVSIQFFDTTPAEEAAIYNRAEEMGGGFPGFCALRVSDAIDGIGPFDELGRRYLPDTLYWALQRLQEEQAKQPCE